MSDISYEVASYQGLRLVTEKTKSPRGFLAALFRRPFPRPRVECWGSSDGGASWSDSAGVAADEAKRLALCSIFTAHFDRGAVCDLASQVSEDAPAFEEWQTFDAGGTWFNKADDEADEAQGQVLMAICAEAGALVAGEKRRTVVVAPGVVPPAQTAVSAE